MKRATGKEKRLAKAGALAAYETGSDFDTWPPAFKRMWLRVIRAIERAQCRKGDQK